MRVGPFGLPELLIILVIILLIFGAKRIPEISSSLGRGIRSFKSSLSSDPDEKNKEEEEHNSEQPTAKTSARDDHR